MEYPPKSNFTETICQEAPPSTTTRISMMVRTKNKDITSTSQPDETCGKNLPIVPSPTASVYTSPKSKISKRLHDTDNDKENTSTSHSDKKCGTNSPNVTSPIGCVDTSPKSKISKRLHDTDNDKEKSNVKQRRFETDETPVSPRLAVVSDLVWPALNRIDQEEYSRHFMWQVNETILIFRQGLAQLSV